MDRGELNMTTVTETPGGDVTEGGRKTTDPERLYGQCFAPDGWMSWSMSARPMQRGGNIS